MKKVLNLLKNVLIILYVLVIIFITICLLSYNDYGITEFGDTTILPVNDENLKKNYKVGDLLVLKKDLSDIKKDDVVFYYTVAFGQAEVNYSKVTAVEKISENQMTISVEGGYRFSSDNLIGKEETTRVIPSAGYVVSILGSRYGFLFLGVLPSLLIFLYTGYTFFLETKMEIEDEEEEEDSKKKKKSSKANEEDDEKVEKTKKSKKTKKTEKVEEAEESEEETEESENEEKAEEPKKVEEKAENSTEAEDKKKAIIEEKLKSMTEEQKRALIEAKLKSMTDEEKKALLEAKRKKMQENK